MYYHNEWLRGLGASWYMTIPDSSWPIRNAINRRDRPWFCNRSLLLREEGRHSYTYGSKWFLISFCSRAPSPLSSRIQAHAHFYIHFNMNRHIPHLQRRWLFSPKSHAIAKAFLAPAASIVPTCQGSLMLRAISSEGQIVHMYQQEEKVQNAPLSSLPCTTSSLRSQLCFVTFLAIRELNVYLLSTTYHCCWQNNNCLWIKKVREKKRINESTTGLWAALPSTLVLAQSLFKELQGTFKKFQSSTFTNNLNRKD